MSCSIKMKKLFDSHCHLQDPRIHHLSPQLITTSIDSGILHFAVNGVSEVSIPSFSLSDISSNTMCARVLLLSLSDISSNTLRATVLQLLKDWHLVKKMGEEYPSSVIPCFGLHPWYVAERTPNWFNNLKEFLHSTPNATVGEIGLDKGSHGKQIDFNDQIQVFQQQLELAKDLKKPASIHCVRAYGDLLQIMQSVGILPGGALLHSYLGSAEMVSPFAKLGAYFSISGYTMALKPQKAKKMLKSVPTDRILLESDSPDGLPNQDSNSLQWIPGDDSKALNHPANIHNVLSFAASMLDISETELAEISYKNAMQLFSCQDTEGNNEDMLEWKDHHPLCL